MNYIFQPRDLETDNKSVHSYDEGSQQMQLAQTISKNSSPPQNEVTDLNIINVHLKPWVGIQPVSPW